MSKIRRDKIAGAIYGFAIGDAMGATTEFMNREQIKKQYGQVTDIIGGGWLGLKAGEVTDDTQMALCVMNAIMASITDSGFRTLNNALYWANAGSFEDAIVGAVNDGGGADTIAAVAGSIAGARFGYDAIPQRWIDQLDSEVKIYLEKFKNFVFSCLQI